MEEWSCRAPGKQFVSLKFSPKLFEFFFTKDSQNQWFSVETRMKQASLIWRCEEFECERMRVRPMALQTGRFHQTGRNHLPNKENALSPQKGEGSGAEPRGPIWCS